MTAVLWEGTVTWRMGCGTYVARCNKCVASCTAGAEWAARAAVGKALLRAKELDSALDIDGEVALIPLSGAAISQGIFAAQLRRKEAA